MNDAITPGDKTERRWVSAKRVKDWELGFSEDAERCKRHEETLQRKTKDQGECGEKSHTARTLLEQRRQPDAGGGQTNCSSQVEGSGRPVQNLYIVWKSRKGVG